MTITGRGRERGESYGGSGFIVAAPAAVRQFRPVSKLVNKRPALILMVQAAPRSQLG